MGMKRTLTQRRFIDAYVKFKGNATEAYLSLHPDCKKTSAADLGYRMLRKVDIKIKEVLDRIGVTDTFLSQKLNEGLGAKKVVSVIPVKPKKVGPNSVNLPDANSRSIEFIDVEDYPTRQRYLDMAFKLKGDYPPEKHEVEVARKVIVLGKKKEEEEDN